MDPDDRVTVFVYGTLRQGGVRAVSKLFPDARLIGTGTVRGWLHDLGAYPGLVLDAGGQAIVGEVYVVTDAALQAMDRIERYDASDEVGSYYVRRRVSAALSEGGALDAWVYECNGRAYRLGTPMSATDWIAYARAKGELRGVGRP
jgi:gamma-glutamylcyclotransferase (GGCT)/AIG2-like uncharacterized protein YtfP